MVSAAESEELYDRSRLTQPSQPMDGYPMVRRPPSTVISSGLPTSSVTSAHTCGASWLRTSTLPATSWTRNRVTSSIWYWATPGTIQDRVAMNPTLRAPDGADRASVGADGEGRAP